MPTIRELERSSTIARLRILDGLVHENRRLYYILATLSKLPWKTYYSRASTTIRQRKLYRRYLIEVDILTDAQAHLALF